eukprot:m.24906 g.24906  ORF g.24906 m.24906 type:complete len:168 (+) comp28698_c0_seq1:207-710(+)
MPNLIGRWLNSQQLSILPISTLLCNDLLALGTTERIFATKTGLFDLCIDNNQVNLYVEPEGQIRRTSADCIRYKEWENERHDMAVAAVGDVNLSQDRQLIRYFRQLNDKIMGKLHDSDGLDMSSHDIQAMGLDARMDFLFVKELIEVYGYDVTLVDDGFGGCCPNLC